jgi:hypothetical protein
MNLWLDWLKTVVLQPRPDRDPRIETVQGEVDSLREDMHDIKRRTEALEAFRRVAERNR